MRKFLLSFSDDSKYCEDEVLQSMLLKIMTTYTPKGLNDVSEAPDEWKIDSGISFAAF